MRVQSLPMICPRCAMAELVGDTPQCGKCGYSAPGAVAVADEALARDPLDEAARQELIELFDIQVLHRRGPASIVYIARDLEVGARVALKVLPRAPEAGAGAQEAFHQATAAAAALDHRHVVPIYSAGTTDNLFWYSLEYVEGQSLAELLHERGPMDLRACGRVVEQVARALDHAHRRGVVHADLKPANVLVDPAGLAHVTDFSVPRTLERLGALDGERTSTRRIEYLAPEERAGAEPGPPADQYALAMLVYECLGGSVPSVTEPPPRLADARPGIPSYAARAVERALSRAPAGRFASAGDFVAALQGATSRSSATSLVPSPAARRSPPVLGPEAFGDALAPLPAPRWRWGIVAGLALAVVGALAIASVVRSAWLGQGSIAPSRAPFTPREADAFALAAVRPESLLAPRPESTATLPPPTPARSLPPAPAPVRIAPPAPPRRTVQQPARLFINATPWGRVYVDGVLIGNTPQAAVAVAPGVHRLLVVREGFQAFDTTFQIASGQELRLTDIVLREVTP